MENPKGKTNGWRDAGDQGMNYTIAMALGAYFLGVVIGILIGRNHR